jgi:PEP-CTERM motif-containing protein
MLKLALAVCAVVSSLFTFQTPALAIGIYNASVQMSFVSEPIPPGTSISFSPGTTFTGGSAPGAQPVGGGNLQPALATSAALASTPGSATALVSGFAGPGAGFRSSSSAFVIADGSASLFNFNTTSVTFPLTVSFTRNMSASIGPGDFAVSSTGLLLAVDAVALISDVTTCKPTCDITNSGSQTFLLGLTPGSHSLNFDVSAIGSAASGSFAPTPEPTTLLLFGTTAAGLGLARWRQRRRKQQQP